jgi:hypothetical protein
VVAQPAAAGQRVGAVLSQPALHVERVILLRPEHARQCLADHQALIVRQVAGRHITSELVGLAAPGTHQLVEAGEQAGR